MLVGAKSVNVVDLTETRGSGSVIGRNGLGLAYSREEC